MVKKDEKKEEEENCGVIKIEAEVVLDCLEWDILILNRNFKVLFANKAFLDKTGLKKCDAIDNFCYKITHHLNQPCQPPHDTCPMEEMFRTGKPAVETHTHFGKNNEQFLANTVTAPLEGFGSDIFLHIGMRVKDGGIMEEEVKNALNKALYVLNVINVYQTQMQELKATKGELEAKISELERFNNLVVDRETKMIELKDKIKRLEESGLKSE